MGTSDLDRGLAGHLFNGYSMRHVKPGLRARIEKYLNEEQGGTGERSAMERAA